MVPLPSGFVARSSCRFSYVLYSTPRQKAKIPPSAGSRCGPNPILKTHPKFEDFRLELGKHPFSNFFYASVFYRYRLRLSLSVIVVTFLVLTAYYSSQQLLTIDSGDVQADAIVVLGGDPKDRSERTAELFRTGKAPKIVVSGRGDCKDSKRLLEQKGVPATVITLESNSDSTLENAKFSIPLLRSLGARRVIIVTSWYHSRRALACFKHFAPDITFYSRPSYEGYLYRDWKRKDISWYLKYEYLKLFGYWAWYGVSPI
jgi:uncharacterized SAM-binding protein YcdF (DUF218 family)